MRLPRTITPCSPLSVITKLATTNKAVDEMIRALL